MRLVSQKTISATGSTVDYVAGQSQLSRFSNIRAVSYHYFTRNTDISTVIRHIL